MSVTPATVAFYTPLKHPFQAEASGDRQIGRALMDGLRTSGFEPELASRLATWRRAFDPSEAERLDRAAALIVATLVRRYRRRPVMRRPRSWMTYQNYHRSPDLLGPAVTMALDIPYILVNPAISSRSRRTAFRPWVSAARLAVRRADLIFAMSPRDVPGLTRLRGAEFAAERLVILPPAVDVARFEVDASKRSVYRSELRRYFAAADGPLCLCVAMMRQADKLDSYKLLGVAFNRLHAERPGRPWRLLVVGDGPARSQVEAALASLPGDRVRLLGALESHPLERIYLGADLFVFPGLGEEYGLVYLEAAAAGLPTVACHGPGPSFMVPPDGGILTDPSPGAFAEGLRRLLDNSDDRQRMGAQAHRFVCLERSMEAFQRRLGDGLARLGLP
ncbi:MAG TPA: glycosyltransferase family 4 protein [Candidatus Methylomirabilis sp.]|nr:glycosyltransferase family 4 protein [Candidatus Methylomirabilis sp.]